MDKQPLMQVQVWAPFKNIDNTPTSVIISYKLITLLVPPTHPTLMQKMYAEVGVLKGHFDCSWSGDLVVIFYNNKWFLVRAITTSPQNSGWLVIVVASLLHGPKLKGFLIFNILVEKVI